MFYKLSGSVGSGKTQAVLEHIRDNLGVGYLLVAPTIHLCGEIFKRVQKVLVDRPEYSNNGPIRLVVSDEMDAEGVYPRAMKACEDYNSGVPPIVIVTTKTFEYLLDHLPDYVKNRFAVYIDEGLPPIRMVTFSPNDKATYLQHLNVDQAHLTTPAEGEQEILAWAAFNPKKLAGKQLDHLNSPSFREISELVLSLHYDAFLWETEKSIEVIAVFSPRQMQAFRSVTLIVAIFERTLMPLLWEQRYGLKFQDSPIAADLFDSHAAKGPLISVWHALHEADLPSRNNFRRNFETGEQGEDDPRKQVIFEAARQLNEQFPDGAYCWAANSDFKNPDNVLEGAKMPPHNAGLNHYQNFDTVFSLLCINPQPWVKKRMLELFDLEEAQLYELWRFSHTYQTIGRCSLRLRDRENPINLVVPSSFCAAQVVDLFPGATNKGQITKLPRLSKPTQQEKVLNGHGIHYTKQDNSAYSKYRKLLNDKGEVPLKKHEWYVEIRSPNLKAKG
ncbi:DEAD/DEAH box helicase family protein [Salipiger mucosus]|uniref:Uncharacterized protein n=1 Tax=Salipiger mucosus DSM 16094 TaxID=1123237 RepID=S9QS69_9RHOB|nr:DEAD/DEAH box helicase family protein [Salipiger mucosus]EPX82513.1 hypothetical protein Salmuc_05263 [Salipiger mucosus DSM 16094]